MRKQKKAQENISNKKAFIKTVEILLVIIITTILSISLIQRQERISSYDLDKNYLINIEKNKEFRQFVIENNGCYASKNLSFITKPNILICIDTINNDFNAQYLETIFFTGNETTISYKRIYLYSLK
ncbi:MAG: hypothetical protein QXE31_02575 [Candidatus Woesearchaeota archaeon]